MRRRVIALTIALIVASAPLLVEICLVVCETSTHVSSHSCSRAVPSNRAPVVAMLHHCEHSEAVPSGPSAQTGSMAARDAAILSSPPWSTDRPPSAVAKGRHAAVSRHTEPTISLRV